MKESTTSKLRILGSFIANSTYIYKFKNQNLYFIHIKWSNI